MSNENLSKNMRYAYKTSFLLIDHEPKGNIHTIRNKQVMLDRDLAEMYDVETKALNQAVKRSRERFPKKYIFQLNKHEINSMVSQNAIPSKQHLGESNPYAFTEQGVSMLSAVLKSKRAIEISIKIIDAFVEI